MREDEMVRWHHRLIGHEFEQALGVGDEQGGLVCCSPWGRKESDKTERLNSTEMKLRKNKTAKSLRENIILLHLFERIIINLSCILSET